jgi:hypothetical protein
MTQSSSLPSNETPLELGIVLYPGMTLLDFAGPQCAGPIINVDKVADYFEMKLDEA